MIFPLQIDIPMARWPWMNWVVLGLLVIGFLAQLANPDAALRFVLGGDEFGLDEHPLSWVGHMFIHADLWHLLGNAWVLWVFGNAICAKVGNAWHLPLFLAFGLFTAFVEPRGLGASGAIYGIIGMSLILYPVNDVTMAWWFFVRFGTFTLPSYGVILIYVIFDLIGLFLGGQAVAYLSHVSGCLAGAALALLLLKVGWLEAHEGEWTVLDFLRGDPKTAGLADRAPAGPGPASGTPHDRLHVRLPNGQVKHLPVHEFLRHEQQGKPVNQFQVSEDGETWATFGEWRQGRV